LAWHIEAASMGLRGNEADMQSNMNAGGVPCSGYQGKECDIGIQRGASR